VRAYALDLLQFARWLEGEGLGLAEVTTEVMLGFLAACRAAVLPGRPGGDVFSIRDGRNAGYAPATINRRLAAVSGLFAFWGLRDPAAPNPVPRGRAARGVARGQRTACSRTWASPGRGPGCGCASRAVCLAGWTGWRRRRCWRAFGPGGIGRWLG
jgi:Phage integrase, N-terminal SAM-like domain